MSVRGEWTTGGCQAISSALPDSAFGGRSPLRFANLPEVSFLARRSAGEQAESGIVFKAWWRGLGTREKPLPYGRGSEASARWKR